MRKLVVVCLFVFAAVCVQAQTLSWDIKFYKTSTWETITDPIISMKIGEKYAISITPASDCFTYIVVYDSEENILVDYHDLAKGGNEVFRGFEVDGAAVTDTFFVIISLTRQERLESLIQAFNRDPSRGNKNALYSEVVSLQRTASRLGEPSSDIIATAATSRGTTNTLEYATRFSDKNMYVRRITIRH